MTLLSFPSCRGVGRHGRKLLVVVGVMLAALLLPVGAAAQRHYKPHIHVGVHGGMTLSKTSFYPSVPETYFKGMNMGVSFRYAEERHVGLLAELNFDQRGWQEDFENAALIYKRKMTYIELPVMTHIFFGGRRVKGFFNLGPQIGYMIGNSIDSNFDYANPKTVEGFPNKPRQTEQMTMQIKNKFDYGITAGAGVEFVIRRVNSITLEGRYYYGLANVFPSSKKDTFSASRGSSIVVTLGYMFRLK